MDLFFCWLLIILVILSGYSYYLIRRSPKGYRLQVKLTIIFILLVLIPSITLTLIVSGLLNQSVQMSFFPEIENSLARSLQIIKTLIEERGKNFFLSCSDVSKLQPSELKKIDILYAASFDFHKNSYKIRHEILTDPAIKPKIDHQKCAQIFTEKLTSTIIKLNDQTIYEIYDISPDSILNVVGFIIDDDIIKAKEQISESLKIYTSLSLVKKSVLEGRIIWGMATIFIIILMLIAIYLAKILSRGITNPIQQLATGMKKVADGDLTSRVNVKAKDEINILVQSFNKMAEDLKTSQQRLVQAERLAAWRDVARRVSHEIKNSLTPIQISLYRLKNIIEPHIDQKPILAIEDEIESLRRISEEFSQFARMPQMKREKTDLNDVIQKLIPFIESGIKPIKIKLELDPNLSEVFLDRDQIKRALVNLLKNSVEASSTGGLITVKTIKIDESGNGIKIEIKDYGTGMDEATLKKVFEPYFTTKNRGMGLGLSIVKRIIEDHDGEIVIESEVGTGTTVTILL